MPAVLKFWICCGGIGVPSLVFVNEILELIFDSLPFPIAERLQLDYKAKNPCHFRVISVSSVSVKCGFLIINGKNSSKILLASKIKKRLCKAKYRNRAVNFNFLNLPFCHIVTKKIFQIPKEI